MAELTESMRKAHKDILWCQCAGLLAPQFLINGFVLNYLKKYNFADSSIMLLIALVPGLGSLLFLMPSGYISDKIGKKRLGFVGNVLQAVGFGALGFIYFFPTLAVPLAVIAIVLFSLGLALFVSSWFALLDPLIPLNMRGRFFANLRITWQVIAFLATFVVFYILGYYDSELTYVIIIGIITFFMFWRIYFYVKVPDLAVEKSVDETFVESLKGLSQNSAYMSFCCFVFVFMFFGASILTFLNLYEKESLGFSDAGIIAMGYSAQLGALAGYWLGAKLVDKSKLAFLFRGQTALAALSVAFFAFVFKETAGVIILSASLTFVFSCCFNSMGIGVTTEAMRQVRIKNRSLGISLSVTTSAAGTVLSSLVSSWYLKNCHDFSLQLGGNSLNHYQSYLLLSAVGLLSVVFYYSLKKDKAF